MKKLLFIALALVLVLSLAACNPGGGNGTNPPASNNGGNASAKNEWPDNIFTEQLPKASFKVKDTDANVTERPPFH